MGTEKIGYDNFGNVNNIVRKNMWVRNMWVRKIFGYEQIFGYEKKNWGVRGSSTRGELDPFSETGRRVKLSIKSKNNYIWGFHSVTAFEVPPSSFVSGSCPETLEKFER
ncbi:hypothetical protein DPMN_057723 [Dreissena polymorpha]|uniref:Uncharacterized protein n=1 Tax=Dreissena polymorpha TaxID=45954 RepID=A0A9D4C0N0_DREPO|nr:hypothetical protein DPMN_057723 [Dreissena polymorpha]